MVELKNDRFAVEVPNEPVVFIFRRTAPTKKAGGKETALPPPAAVNKSRDDASILRHSSAVQQPTGIVYLVEVHYYLRLKTDQVGLSRVCVWECE